MRAAEPAASAAPSPRPAVAEERALIDDGIALRKAQDDRAARAAFSKAWSLGSSPEALAQLALAEQALGLWLEAHEHLRAALQRVEHAWIRHHRPTLEAALAEIESRLGRLEVACNIAGAEVSLDGRVVASTPLDVPLYLLAGRSVIQVSGPGYFEVTRQVQIDAGALSRLDVTLTPNALASTPPRQVGQAERGIDGSLAAAGEAPRGRAPAADLRSSEVSAREVLQYGSLGLAALGVTVGVTGYVLREVNVRKYNEDSVCSVERGLRRSEECAGEAAAWRLGEGLAIGGFAAAGVFGAVGLYLWLGERSGHDLASSACRVGLDGMACRLRF